MALNFPDAPTNNQVFTDATTGEQWKYETATNSWTSLGLTTSGGIIYKGGINITATPPTGVASGWTYSVTTGGTANAGFTGLSGTISVGSQVVFDGANWQLSGSSGPWSRTGTVVSPTNAGDKVGIGTSTPKSQLQVLDELRVSDSTQSNGSLVLGDGGSTAFNVGIARWDASTNTAGAGGIGYFTQGSANRGGHYFYTGDTQAGSQTERVRIATDGRVLVGPAGTPAVSLDPGTTTAPLVRDSQGRVLVGTATASTNAKLQVEGAARLQNFANKAELDTAMPAPVAGCLATVNSKLYFHDGTDWKEVTLGAALT